MSDKKLINSLPIDELSQGKIESRLPSAGRIMLKEISYQRHAGLKKKEKIDSRKQQAGMKEWDGYLI